MIFVGSLFGFTPNRFTTVLIAAGLMLLCLLINLSGTRTLGRVAMAGFVAELIGALFVDSCLLFFERHHDFGAFFDGLGTQGDGSYAGAFLAASLPRPLPVLRLRGVRRRRRGGAGPGPHDPDRDAADDLRRRRGRVC